MIPTSGDLVFLAGPSCAGKTTLGCATRDLLGLPWLFWEIDRVAPRLPESAVIQAAQAARLTQEELESALLVQDRLVEASVGAIRAYVDLGFSIIAELFLWDERHRNVAERVLAGVEPLVVELQCPVEVLEERERLRASTYEGTARQQASWKWLLSPDLVLDAARPPDDLARDLASWLSSSPTSRWHEPMESVS